MSYEIERRPGDDPFAADAALAWQLFSRAPAVHFAAAGDEPVLRTLSAVVYGGSASSDERAGHGSICFHGGDHGEKLGLVGRRVVASCEQVVTQVASYFVHPELACPASTYYLSAQVSGVVRRVEDLEHKARILTALMERFQPEGGYLPIRAEEAPYRKVLEKLLVCELTPETISAKRKLGQHRTRAQIERLLAALWRRGQPGDVAALRTILEAHPDRPEPPLLATPDPRVVLGVAPDMEDARQVAELLKGQYWTQQLGSELLQRAHLFTPAWVVARTRDGRVVGSARVVSDGARFGYLMDVVVHDEHRGRGVGKALTALALDHPQVRGTLRVGLRTRDAQRFYEPFGFSELVPHPDSLEMVRELR